ncbi:hypothetical protein GXW82_43435 [Streptacidiphilus sp. 4-A2]|nr:hypothetical protein [Streptacidiphilus sp. 4-A2]
MADGKTEQISRIKVGDRVESADPTTGKPVGARTVQATLVHLDSNLVSVGVRDGRGRTSTLDTTTEHLFWDATSRDWVPADQLQPGHALRTLDGTRAVVADVQRGHGSAYRYNLTVDQLHTYYVLAGSTPVLVHNCQLALGWRTKGTAEWAGENGFNHMIANPTTAGRNRRNA